MNPLEDGTKHVNISYQAKTPLGRMLSPPHPASFKLPEEGTFSSVGGYWYWLLFEPSPKHRSLSGEDVFVTNPNSEAQKQVKSQEFQQKILRATWHKIRQNNRIFWRFEQNILPYRRYYVGESDIYKPADAEWLCDGLTVMEDYIDNNFW